MQCKRHMPTLPYSNAILSVTEGARRKGLDARQWHGGAVQSAEERENGVCGLVSLSVTHGRTAPRVRSASASKEKSDCVRTHHRRTAVQNRRPPREKYDAVSIEQNGGRGRRGRAAADPANHRRDRYVSSGRDRKWSANFVDNLPIFVMKGLPTLH